MPRPRKPTSRPPLRHVNVDYRAVRDLYASIFGKEPDMDTRTTLTRLRAFGFDAKHLPVGAGRTKEEFEINPAGEYAMVRVLAARKGWRQLTTVERNQVTGRIVEGILHQIIQEGKTPIPFFEKNKGRPRNGVSVLERLRSALQLWNDYAREDKRILASFASIKKISASDRKKVDLYERKFLQARGMADYHEEAIVRYLAMLGVAESEGTK